MTQKNTWSRFPNELFVREDITPLVKVVYVYMLQKHQFFVVDRKQQYYETQEQIAESCNIGRKAANTAIKTLTSLGWITVKKQKQRGPVENNIYTVKDVFCVYQEQKQKKTPSFPVVNKRLFNPLEDDDIF